MNYLIGLDMGTSATKGVLVSEKGQIIATKSVKTDFIKPEKSYLEVDPESHYQKTRTLIGELATSMPKEGRLLAFSFSGASGNALLLDEKNKPLHNIINWLDMRAIGKTAEIAADLDTEGVHEVVGWPWSERFPLAQFAWLKHFKPELFRKARHFGMATDYIYYRLTGRFVLDHSTATTFFLQNQKLGRYHIPYLGFLNIDQHSLPELVETGSVVGSLRPEEAEAMGLDRNVKVIAGSFDHPSAARATSVFTEDHLLLSLGTSWVGYFPTLRRNDCIEMGLLLDYFFRPDGPYGAMFAITGVGQNIDRYVESIFTEETDTGKRFRKFNEEAEKAPPGANSLFINPFREQDRIPELAKEYLASHSTEDICRAVMEGGAFEFKKRMDQMAKIGLDPKKINLSGGPSSSRLWAQILSEITGSSLYILHGQEAGAAGAALVAATGAGLFENIEEAAQIYKGQEVVIEPDPENRKLYQDLYQRYLKEQT